MKGKELLKLLGNMSDEELELDIDHICPSCDEWFKVYLVAIAGSADGSKIAIE